MFQPTLAALSSFVGWYCKWSRHIPNATKAELLVATSTLLVHTYWVFPWKWKWLTHLLWRSINNSSTSSKYFSSCVDAADSSAHYSERTAAANSTLAAAFTIITARQPAFEITSYSRTDTGSWTYIRQSHYTLTLQLKLQQADQQRLPHCLPFHLELLHLPPTVLESPTIKQGNRTNTLWHVIVFCYPSKALKLIIPDTTPNYNLDAMTVDISVLAYAYEILRVDWNH